LARGLVAKRGGTEGYVSVFANVVTVCVATPSAAFTESQPKTVWEIHPVTDLQVGAG
jgi:hypothetical protein